MPYFTSVRDDVANVREAVGLRGRVRALRGEVGEAWDLEREALAVHNMPVELVDLGESLSDTGHLPVIKRTLTQLIASSVRLMSSTGKLQSGSRQSRGGSIR